MNHQILEQLEKVILWETNLRAHRVDFTAFYHAIGNWWEKHVVNYTVGRESDGKVSILWGKYGNQFPRLFPFDGLSCIFLCYGKLMGKWENPCISQVIKYTIEWESNGKKAPILWKKYEYQFPSFSQFLPLL